MNAEDEVQAVLDAARTLGLTLHPADLWRGADGVLRVRGEVPVWEWLSERGLGHVG